MLPSFLLFETGFAREKSHLCCKDHLWKPFAFCLLAMYWFDPLVWAAYWLACRDIEFACDERVIRALKMPERKAYASALLACSDGRKRVLVCPVGLWRDGGGAANPQRSELYALSGYTGAVRGNRNRSHVQSEICRAQYLHRSGTAPTAHLLDGQTVRSRNIPFSKGH